MLTPDGELSLQLQKYPIAETYFHPRNVAASELKDVHSKYSDISWHIRESDGTCTL